MGDEIAADDHEFCVGLVGLHGLKAGAKQHEWRVDSARVAGLLKGVKRLFLVGGGRRRENRFPLGHGRSNKRLHFCGIMKGIEMDVADHERRDGVNFSGFGLIDAGWNGLARWQRLRQCCAQRRQRDDQTGQRNGQLEDGCEARKSACERKHSCVPIVRDCGRRVQSADVPCMDEAKLDVRALLIRTRAAATDRKLFLWRLADDHQIKALAGVAA